MNKDNAKDYLPLVQALAEGKTIQYYSPTTAKWHDETAVDFNHPPNRYRIKPERIKKKMWYKESMLYPYTENYGIWSAAKWCSEGYKLVEVEFDAP